MEQEMNQNMHQGNPDETAAVLSFATHLSQKTMPQQPQPQETGDTSNPQNTNEVPPEPQKKTVPEANNKDVEKLMDAKLTEFKKEIEGTIKEQIGSIKD